jgi:hypothetical protein
MRAFDVLGVAFAGGLVAVGVAATRGLSRGRGRAWCGGGHVQRVWWPLIVSSWLTRSRLVLIVEGEKVCRAWSHLFGGVVAAALTGSRWSSVLIGPSRCATGSTADPRRRVRCRP